MTRYLLMIAIALCTGCAVSPETEAHRRAFFHFTYVPDVIDERRIYDSIDEPFYGDCEDYAFTLQRVIGGDVWLIQLPDSTHHAALVKNSTVYDNNSRWPIERSKYDGRFIRVMTE